MAIENTLTVISTLKQQLKKACESTEFRLNERLEGNLGSVSV